MKINFGGFLQPLFHVVFPKAILKFSIFFFCTSVFGLSPKTSYSQDTKITIEKNQRITIKQMLQLINGQSGYKFIFNNNLISGTTKVSLEEGITRTAILLDKTLSPLDLTYSFTDDHTIHIRKKPLITLETHLQKVNVINQMQVTGLVSDENGQPLPGASIVEKNTNNGVQTDFDGNFSLDVSNLETTLIISYIGFKSQEIPLTGQSSISVVMKEDAATLDEVVVVGYGSLKKRDITGSVGSLKMDETLQSRAVVDFGQAMSGRMSGVQVLNASGRPGTSSAIQIRGTNSITAGSSPLIVIDGVQLPEYNLNSINSSDIESIEVLKDASSASIYGSRGANGVILITTKSGKAGSPVFLVNYTSSIQQVIRQIEVMNSSEYAQTFIDAAQNGWVDSGGDPNAPNTIEARGNYRYTWPDALENPETLPNTNFQDQIFRAAPMHKIDLSYSGGTEKSNYSVSGGYVNQKGIMISSEYQKYSLNLNVNSEINEWLSAGALLNTVYDYEEEPFNRTVEWAVQYPSIYPLFGSDGNLGGPLNLDGFENYSSIIFRPNNGHPLYRINDDIQHRRLTSMGNLFLKLKFNDGLNFKTSFNAFYKQVNNSNYNAGDHNLGDAFKTTANYTADMNRTLSYTWNNVITYDRSIADHTINAIAGFEYNHRDYYMNIAGRQGYDNDNIHSLSAGQEIVEADDDAAQTNLVSVFSRINYNFLGRYTLAASFRRDGSSRFGPNTKWGNFYSLSGAWQVNEEKFLKSLFPTISNLKFKLSYGETGNDNFSDYRWISILSQARTAIGNNLTTTYYPSNIENQDLEWEGTKQLNFGFDLGLFENRINLDADFYSSRSDNLLLDIPVPSTSGFTSAFTNDGVIANKGLELNLQTRNINKDNWSWTTQINFSINRNEVEQLGRNNASQIFGLGSFGRMQKINIVGEPVFGFYGYQYEGVYLNQAEIDADPSSLESTKPGDGRYKDVNGDGILNADDRTIIGNVQPDFTWGFNNNFTFGNLDFSFSFQGVVGGEIYDDNAHRSLVYHEGRNFLEQVNGRWVSEQDPGDGYHSRVSVDVTGLQKTASSYWLADQTYLRLKDVTVGFTIPEKITSSLNISNARLFFNGLNMFTISDAPVYDPENFLNTDVANALYKGVGGAAYPSAKIFSLGLNVKF